MHCGAEISVPIPYRCRKRLCRSGYLSNANQNALDSSVTTAHPRHQTQPNTPPPPQRNRLPRDHGSSFLDMYAASRSLISDAAPKPPQTPQSKHAPKHEAVNRLCCYPPLLCLHVCTKRPPRFQIPVPASSAACCKDGALFVPTSQERRSSSRAFVNLFFFKKTDARCLVFFLLPMASCTRHGRHR